MQVFLGKHVGLNVDPPEHAIALSIDKKATYKRWIELSPAYRLKRAEPSQWRMFTTEMG